MVEQAPGRPPSQEKALLDYIERLDKRRTGRLALHVKLSRLSRAHARAHYLQMATDMFSDAIRTLEGQFFILRNHDLVFVAVSAPFATLDRIVDRLRSLFSEDPVLAHKDSDDQSFCTWYRLETDFDALHIAARQWVKEADQAKVDYIRKDPTEGLTPIQPDLLGRIEHALEKTDVTNIVRRQTICTMIPGQAPQPLFEELYISILDLQAAITPGVNWLADPWLFQYLTQTLDKRMMAMLTKSGPPREKPFSINLNVSSVLSPEFRRFDEITLPLVRGRPMIEFSKLDVFADMGAFIFARDFLHERGYRICLDGLTHLTLPYCNRARLGFDLIKIFWRPEGIEDMQPDMLPAIHEIVMEAGQARVILCRCENAKALEIGQQLGIVMFQGRHVDRILSGKSPTSKI
jgi:hypothetical protein